jgi:hypothetical protein
MDDPDKLPLPTIPHKTMVVHGIPRSALPLPTPPPTLRSRQAAAAATKLTTVSEVLLPCFRRHRSLCFHRYPRLRFRCCCRRCIQLIVDCCLCPHHRCHRRCLHCHRGNGRSQNGGCCGHARRHCAANVAAAAAVLPASCRCRQAAAATAATALLPHFPPRRCRQ